MKKLAIAIIIAALFSCAPNTGTITETDSGIVGKVKYSTGSGAANARVQLFGARDTTRLVLDSSLTDLNGNFGFHKLQPGSYNVWIEGPDSLLALIDSIYVPRDSDVIANATLYKGGSVTAIVALQPGHSPTSVFVQALGTQRYANVNSSGRFTVFGLAQGEYTLRLVSTIPGYTPTYKSVTIASGVNDTLKDTIYMVYSGIPIVTGIQATFDNYTGIARIAWNKLDYADFYEYKIYREVKGALNPQPVLIAVSPDSNVIYDTIYKPKIPDSTYSAGDTSLDANVNYRYRVTVVNKSMAEGQVYNFADVPGSDPAGLVSMLTPVQNQKFKDSVGISCSWNKVASAGKYEVQVSLKPDFSSVLVDSIMTDTMKILPKLGIGYYYLRARAQNGGGEWGFWNGGRRFAVVGGLFAKEIAGTENLNVRNLARTADGGFIVEGITQHSGDYTFIKTDSTGTDQWRLPFTQTEIGTCLKAEPLSDGGILIISTLPNSLGINIGVVIKIDQTGALLWRKEYPDSSGAVTDFNCAAMPDNKFVIAYSTGQNISAIYTSLLHLIVCDNSGTPEVTNSTDTSTASYTKPLIQVISNDSIVLITQEENDTANILHFGSYVSGLYINTIKVPTKSIGRTTNIINAYEKGSTEIAIGDDEMISSTVYFYDKQFQLLRQSNYSGGFLQFTNSSQGNFYLNWCIAGNSGANVLRKTTSALNKIWEKSFFGLFIVNSDESLIATNNPESYDHQGNIKLYKISKDGLSFEN